MDRMRVLFVCMQNRDRSRVAEELYREDMRYEVRSAGTRVNAGGRGRLTGGKQITDEDIQWADRIFAADQNVLCDILGMYRSVDCKKLVTLDVPGIYDRSRAEQEDRLKKALVAGIYPHLGRPRRRKGS